MISGNIIRVALADDHELMREGLIRQLSADTKIHVVMEARHGLDFLQQLQEAKETPDVAVIDLNMPAMDGFALSAALKKNYPAIKVLVLTGYCSDYNIALMVHNGVRGYLLKECRPSEFREAIHNVYETGYHYSVQLTEKTFKILQNDKTKSYNIPEREMEFLKLCCSDLKYDEMAKEMGITKKTLSGCRERLFERLNVNSRTELLLFAMQSGIYVTKSDSNKFNIKY